MTNVEFRSIVEAYDDYFMSLYQSLHNPAPVMYQQAYSHIQAIEQDRKNQRYGWNIRQLIDGQWEVYEWEKISELHVHQQGLALFDKKWQAEQYINSILHG
jgi:hypothetical protein